MEPRLWAGTQTTRLSSKAGRGLDMVLTCARLGASGSRNYVVLQVFDGCRNVAFSRPWHVWSLQTIYLPVSFVPMVVEMSSTSFIEGFCRVLGLPRGSRFSRCTGFEDRDSLELWQSSGLLYNSGDIFGTSAHLQLLRSCGSRALASLSWPLSWCQ